MGVGAGGWVVNVFDVYCVLSECDQVCMAILTLLCVCYTMIPDNSIGAEGAKALALELGCLSQLTVLNLSGE